MTVQLGNIILDNNLRLYGLEEAEDISVAQYVAFDGSVDVLLAPAQNRRSLRLVGNRDGSTVRGRYRLQDLEAIKSLARSGQAQELIHNRGVFSVLILSVTEPLAIIDKTDPTGDDWYTATINMIEV